MKTLARICIGLWILLILMVIGILSVDAHDAPPPAEIRNANPRLASEDHWTEDGWHYHQWCYDLEGTNGQVGTWQDAWEIDDLPSDPPPPPPPPRDPGPPRDPDPPVVVDPPKAVDPPKETTPEHTEDTDGKQSNVQTDDTQESPKREVAVRSESVQVVEAENAAVAAAHNIVLTQVMFHDWGNGQAGLPQWFELHNRGGDANLEGYTLTFQVRTKDFGVYEEEVIILKDFQLPAGETMIVTRRRVGKFLGHLWGYTEGVKYVYVDENIPNLKNKWVLTDPSGKVVYRRDHRWNYGWGKHIERNRAAFDVIPSENYTGEEPIYYGSCFDRGNPPGFHRDVVPQAPQLRRKRIGLWGDLKVR